MIRDRDFDKRVGRVVKVLGKAAGVPMTQVAKDLGLSYTGLNARLAGDTSFSAAEVRVLAEYFEVDPGVFFEDPVELVSGRPRTSSGRSPSSGSGSSPRKSGWISEGPTLVAA